MQGFTPHPSRGAAAGLRQTGIKPMENPNYIFFILMINVLVLYFFFYHDFFVVYFFFFGVMLIRSLRNIRFFFYIMKQKLRAKWFKLNNTYPPPVKKLIISK